MILNVENSRSHSSCIDLTCYASENRAIDPIQASQINTWDLSRSKWSLSDAQEFSDRIAIWRIQSKNDFRGCRDRLRHRGQLPAEEESCFILPIGETNLRSKA
jgi:hypothetical protein